MAGAFHSGRVAAALTAAAAGAPRRVRHTPARQASRLHRLAVWASCRHASIQGAATSRGQRPRTQAGPRRGQAARDAQGDRPQAATASANTSGRGRAAARGRQPQGSKHQRQLTCQGASPTAEQGGQACKVSHLVHPKQRNHQGRGGLQLAPQPALCRLLNQP